ncbi:MAG TPA: FliM/FliN family flagellar motor switch protein [Rhodanobacteraceae bacterium]
MNKARTDENGTADKPSGAQQNTPARRAGDIVPVRLGEIEDKPVTGPVSTFEASVLDRVQLDVSIELGRTQLSFRRIRGLAQGAIVELDRPVGDPLDIRVNGRLVARGEVVSIKGERYGVRLTEVIKEDGAEEPSA